MWASVCTFGHEVSRAELERQAMRPCAELALEGLHLCDRHREAVRRAGAACLREMVVEWSRRGVLASDAPVFLAAVELVTNLARPGSPWASATDAEVTS